MCHLNVDSDSSGLLDKSSSPSPSLGPVKLGPTPLLLLLGGVPPGGSCMKIGLPGKSILRDYVQENTVGPFLLLRISFPGVCCKK